MFIHRVHAINIVAKAISCGKDKVAIREIHGGGFFTKADVQCTTLIASVVGYTSAINGIGP